MKLRFVRNQTMKVIWLLCIHCRNKMLVVPSDQTIWSRNMELAHCHVIFPRYEIFYWKWNYVTKNYRNILSSVISRLRLIHLSLYFVHFGNLVSGRIFRHELSGAYINPLTDLFASKLLQALIYSDPGVYFHSFCLCCFSFLDWKMRWALVLEQEQIFSYIWRYVLISYHLHHVLTNSLICVSQIHG